MKSMHPSRQVIIFYPQKDIGYMHVYSVQAARLQLFTWHASHMLAHTACMCSEICIEYISPWWYKF